MQELALLSNYNYATFIIAPKTRTITIFKKLTINSCHEYLVHILNSPIENSPIQNSPRNHVMKEKTVHCKTVRFKAAGGRASRRQQDLNFVLSPTLCWQARWRDCGIHYFVLCLLNKGHFSACRLIKTIITCDCFVSDCFCSFIFILFRTVLYWTFCMGPFCTDTEHLFNNTHILPCKFMQRSHIF